MSALPPFIDEWNRLGLEWGYVQSQILRPFSIPAGAEVQLPTRDFIFKYPEGVITDFSGIFDDPRCGIRLELNPNLDTLRDFTPQNAIIFGGVNPENLVYAVVPPVSLPGVFMIRILSPWVFKDWARLYVFNTDAAAAHNCLGHAYHIIALKEPRPDDRIVPLKKIQLIYEMYPECRNLLRSRLAEYVKKCLEEVGIKNVKELEEI